MKKNVITLIEKESGINRKRYPLNLYFLNEKEVDDVQTPTKKSPIIIVSKLNYEGGMKHTPYSQLSLITNPNEYIEDEK